MAKPARQPQSRLTRYRYALLTDLGLLRSLVGNNAHWVAPELVRSGQPLPWHLRRLARHHGLQSVLSLRSPSWDSAPLILEREACSELGLAFEQVKLRSYKAPTPGRIHALLDAFARLPYPLLVHCKSGIDRTGLAAALYLHVQAGWPIERIGQFRFWPYLYLGGGPSGILPQFLASYRAHPLAREGRFQEWLDSAYDPRALEAAFTPSPVMTVLTRRILRRE